MVRSIKQECLSKLVLFGPGSLSRVLTEYSAHYHRERNHQGKGNLLLFPQTPDNSGRTSSVECKPRLGGLLKCYERAAWISWPYGVIRAASVSESACPLFNGRAGRDWSHARRRPNCGVRRPFVSNTRRLDDAGRSIQLQKRSLCL